MTWNETNIALKALMHSLSQLPNKTKDNSEEYERLAKPIRELAIELHYIRINLSMKKQYE